MQSWEGKAMLRLLADVAAALKATTSLSQGVDVAVGCKGTEGGKGRERQELQL